MKNSRNKYFHWTSELFLIINYSKDFFKLYVFVHPQHHLYMRIWFPSTSISVILELFLNANWSLMFLKFQSEFGENRTVQSFSTLRHRDIDWWCLHGWVRSDQKSFSSRFQCSNPLRQSWHEARVSCSFWFLQSK